MNKKNKAFLLGFSLLLISRFAFAGEPVVSIPLNTFINPTFDLVDQSGNKLNAQQLDAKFRQGIDLSKFNPEENNYWQNQKFPAVDAKLNAEMPAAENAIVNFETEQGAYREANLYSILVHPTNNASLSYGLTFGLQIHTSLIRSALLRKLGVYQESPKYFKTITVQFESAERMDQFIKKAFNVEGSAEDNIDYLSLEPFQRGIISDVNNQKKTLVLHGAYMEKFSATVPSLFDGLTPATSQNLNLFGKSRGYRSLVVPFVVADLGESLNRVSLQSATMRGGSVILNYLNSTYFNGLTSADDAKWMLRRMAALTDQDWNEIVAAGHYPDQLQGLVKVKLLYRMKNMIQNFFSKGDQAQLLQVPMPSTQVNSADGSVVDGKVMRANFVGYPPRFAHGDRQSPFETADLIKFVKIKAQAATLKVALSALGEKLKLRQTQLTQNVTGLEIGPAGISQLGHAEAITKELSYSADRIITTGTYYGSQAPVQLVDSVSVTGAIGYQKLLIESGGISKNYGANVGYRREFTYVTPIKTIKEADQASWKNLLYKSKLNSIVAPLEEGKNLTEFMANLKEGEVFTITDSVGLMGAASVNAIIDNLIGFSSLGNLMASLSVDVNKSVILRQTQVVRTAEGLQVYVRDGSSLAYGVQFDVNYFINLLRIRSVTQLSDLHTEAYLINYNAALMKQVESGEITLDDTAQKSADAQKVVSEKATQSLLALLKQSNLAPLRQNFGYQRFEITHGLKTKELQIKFLWNRSTKMEEEHILSVYKPEMVAPEGTVVNNRPLQLSLYSKGELHGSDLLGFGTEILDATSSKFLGQHAPQFAQPSQNPSQVPFGKAYWRMVRSDSDLSTDRSTALPSVSTVEHVWSGWSLKQANLQAILQELRESLKNLTVVNAVIPEGALQQTKKIDFYRITSHLTLLPNAIDKIKDLIIAPEITAKQDKARFFERLFSKLSTIGSKARLGDKVVFSNLMRVMGNGDEKVGLQNYNFECRSTKGDDYSSSYDHGNHFECLEAWATKLMDLANKFPKDNIRGQNKWMTHVLYTLEEKIPQAYLMNELGKDKFIYYIDFVGFRAGDEDGDDGIYTPFVVGEPAKKSEYGNGLISLLGSKLKILPTEIMTSKLSAQ